MTATMSVLGLYNYDDSIFDNMAFPELMTETEKTDTINNIILECAELEVLYTNPAFMKFAIQTWSRKELPTWVRVYNASVAEYDPIENYNRYEESTQTTDMTRQHSGNDTRRMVIDQTESNRGTDTTTNSGKDTTQLSGSDGSHTVIDADEAHTGTDTTTNTGSDVTTNQIAGFDSNTLVDHDKSTLAHGHGTSLLHGESVATDTTEDITITHGKKEELTHGLQTQLAHGHAVDTDADNTETTTHGLKIEDDGDVTTESHIHGNIGVTTSQQMLESELEVAPKLNIINYITESFKKRFCLLVY